MEALINHNQNDNILPQYRRAACVRFLQPILTFLSNPGETVQIQITGLAQSTIAARLRDAIHAYRLHNWETFTLTQMNTLQTAIVRSCSSGVFIGTRETLHNGIPFAPIMAEIRTDVKTTCDIEITNSSGITPIHYLIENGLLSPSPLFHYNGPLSAESLESFAGQFPKVTHFTDPTNPNRHSFL